MMLPWLFRRAAPSADAAATVTAQALPSGANATSAPHALLTASPGTESGATPHEPPAIVLELLPAARLAVFTVRRQPSFDEWRSAIDTLTSSPDYAPGTALISDRRALADSAAPDTIRRMADYLGALRDTFAGCRWAVVTDPENPAEFGMARIGERLFESSAGIMVRAFTDIDAALRWTGHPWFRHDNSLPLPRA